MRSPVVVAVLGALLSLPCTTLGQEEWAVVVGIDDYEFLHGVEGGDLLGAEHDALGFADYLIRGQGVPQDHVRLLLGGDATGPAIRQALSRWLLERVEEGDRVYVFFSGHGSQVLDADGDEVDGLDETLSPVDALPLSPRNDIVDDEIRTMLAKLPAAEVVVILDSCSSGTATKVTGLDARPRHLDRPLERPKAAEQDSGGWELAATDTTRIVELAASGPDQTALDVAFRADDGSVAFYGGAFTTHLLERLWSAPDSATLAEVLQQTQRDMQDQRFTQQPQFSGRGNCLVKARRAGAPQPK